MRSSRQTELSERYPIHVVCAWIGNSPVVAADHYLQVRDEYFSDAVQDESGAVRSGAESSEAGGKPEGEDSVFAVLSGTEHPDMACRTGPGGFEPPQTDPESPNR